eukprot:6106152-Amphidinium_carterae.1
MSSVLASCNFADGPQMPGTAKVQSVATVSSLMPVIVVRTCCALCLFGWVHSERPCSLLAGSEVPERLIACLQLPSPPNATAQ